MLVPILPSSPHRESKCLLDLFGEGKKGGRGKGKKGRREERKKGRKEEGKKWRGGEKGEGVLKIKGKTKPENLKRKKLSWGEGRRNRSKCSPWCGGKINGRKKRGETTHFTFLAL